LIHFYKSSDEIMILWAFIFTLILYWYVDRRKKFQLLKEYGYNVPPTNLIFGNLLELVKDDLNTQIRWMNELGESIGSQGGKIIGWYRGPSPAIWTTSPEFLKEVLIKDSENFIDRPMLDRSDNIPHLINLKGTEWKRTRSTLSPTFSSSKLKKMSEILTSTIHTTISIIDTKVEKGENVDFNEVYQRLTLETIGRCGLGMNVNCQVDEKDKLLEMVRAALDKQVDTIVILSSCFPALESLLAWIFSRRGRKRTNHVILDKCWEVLTERRRNPPHPTPVDALQLCIDAAGADGKISDYEIVAQGLIFILAGYETTAAAMNFTTYLLATHPEVQDRLREEIQQTFGDNVKPNYDNVNSLQYLDMVFSESLRLYPPIPLHLGRWARKERTICGKRIPKGTGVLAPTWALHHDPAFWKDPWKFDPERFSPENRDKIIEMSYLPFGDGPRNCIGRRFALMEAKMALVEVFRRYKVSACERTPNPLPIRNKGLTLAAVGDKIILKAERI